MLLDSKTAVIYGAGGAIGAGVARAFAREGAFVHLTGHHLASVASIADQILASGGRADAAQIDALDVGAVETDLDRLIATHGRVDVSFNAVSIEQQMGCRLTDISRDDFLASVSQLLETNFITMSSAAKRMEQQGSGVILAITATVARTAGVDTGTFSVAGASIEGLCRQLAVDLGPRNVRVICLRSAGSPDAAGVSETFDIMAREQGISRDEFENALAEGTLLKRLPRVTEFADAAVLMASDYASAFTGAAANVNCGEYLG
jgi:3-oxoacyl-[acyl-carrier protein] reductase